MFIRGGETITIKRRTESGVDAYNLPTFTTQNITVRDCLIAFGSTSEPVEVDREPIDAALTLYLPPGTDIDPGDIFHLRGTDFVKDGDSQDWESPFDGLPVGVVVKVRRRRG